MSVMREGHCGVVYRKRRVTTPRTNQFPMRFINLKQDVNRHLKFFKTSRDQNKFKKLMNEASNAPTSIQAEQASKALDSLIERCSSDPTKMMNFKKWWWRRRARWQQWCKSYSTSSASSAEVSNAKAIESACWTLSPQSALQQSWKQLKLNVKKMVLKRSVKDQRRLTEMKSNKQPLRRIQLPVLMLCIILLKTPNRKISLIPVYFQNRYSNIIPRSVGESSPYALSFESKNVIEFDFASTFS